jgi:hypothetical protein
VLLKGREHFEDIDVGGGHNIQIDFKGIEWQVVDWIQVAAVWAWWRDILNRLLNFLVPQKFGICLFPE